MIDYLNQFFDVIQKFVDFMFSLYVVPNVSIGSFLLVSLILLIIVKTFWLGR